MPNCSVRSSVSSLAAAWLLLLAASLAHGDMTPFGADPLFDTSEYALGSHTLNVVFLQDNQLRDPVNNTHPVTPGGSIVHWTSAELASRSQRAIDAATFWTTESVSRHHPAARLDVRVNFVNDGNPITVTDIGGEGSSIGYGDALAFIDPDYAMFSDVNAVRHFNNDTREQLGTHWASTVFIKPYNGRASAFINGPYVNAYEDDSTWTHAHEYGHTFGARDEYGSATTSTRSGYLYEFNTNAVNLPDGSPNPDSIPAIMRTRDVYTVADGTIGQIGWRDTANDTIPDILDTFPTLTIDTSHSNSSLGLASVDLSSIVTPLVSPDPNEDDYTINTIESAQYRLNQGLWQSLSPNDGQFGDYSELFSLELAQLPFGSHDIELRVFNSVDNFSVESFQFNSQFASPDFDADGQIDCADVNALVAEIVGGTNGPIYDMDGNGNVDDADLQQWLQVAGAANLPSGNAYLMGDANLDGSVDGEDFLAWNDHKFTTSPAWCDGDFDANGEINGEDFLVWNANKFTSSDAFASDVTAIPEPNLSFVCGFIALLVHGRSRKSFAKFEIGSIAPSGW